MDIILYFFRDKIVGLHYLMYAFVCLFLMFSIIGYLFKQKYGKLEIILNTSQVKTGKVKEIEPYKTKKEKKLKKSKKNNNKIEIENVEVIEPIKNQSTENITNQQVINQPIQTNQEIVNQNIDANNSISNQVEIKPVVSSQVNLNEGIPEIE